MKKREDKIGWRFVRGELRKRFRALNDDDLRWDEGRVDELIHRIRSLTGETKEAVVFALAAAVDAWAFAQDGLLRNCRDGRGTRLVLD